MSERMEQVGKEKGRKGSENGRKRSGKKMSRDKITWDSLYTFSTIVFFILVLESNCRLETWSSFIANTF